jgi:hypothetical protein
VTTRRIVSALQPDETVIAQARMGVGHWSTGDFLAAGGGRGPQVLGLCLTEQRLLFLAVAPWFNRITGKLVAAIPLSEVATIESQGGRTFTGTEYCRLTLTLRDASTYQFHAQGKPAIMSIDALSAQMKPRDS